MFKFNKLVGLLSIAMFFGVVVSVDAQSDRKFNKMQEKQYKDNLKALKKAGWVTADKTYTLDFALAKFYRALHADEDNNMQWIGRVASCSATCANVALTDAQTRYAQQASSLVRGRVTNDMFNNQSVGQPEEFVNFYAAYETLISKEISGLMKQYLAIERPISGGKPGFKEYEIWYIVNEADASKARIRAMQLALEESKMAQKHAEQIANFVREGFKQD